MSDSLKVIIKIVLVILLTSLSAQFAIDLEIGGANIPITGQSLAVMVGCIFLSPKDAMIAMLGYLILGAAGLPIFAEGSSGIDKLTGGSAGFLFGFVLSGYLIAYLGSLSFRSSFLKALAAMLITTIVLLLAGNAVLILKYGFQQGLEYGFFPFWRGGIIKAIIGAIIIVFIEKLTIKAKIKS